MKKVFQLTLFAMMAILIASCGGGKDNSDLGKKKAELEKLKTEQKKINDQVSKLEEEIAKVDTSASVAAKAKLVAIKKIGTDSFSHYIDLQGKIDAQNVAMVAPRGVGGVVRNIFVKQGQIVRKGQVILTLDNALAAQQLKAAQVAIPGAESSAKLAQSVYERQQNLWKENIGTEVQVLEAKNKAETAAAALESARAQVRLAQETAAQSRVIAEISGTIDVVNVRIGESFSAQSAANPATGIRIVNTGDLKVLVQVPENYLERVNVGNNLRVTLPETGQVINTKVTVASKLIDQASRSFFIEAKMPQDKNIKPNQIAKVQIMDYANNTAITVPVNTLQTDDKGKYVLVAVTEGGKLVARKKVVTVGQLYGDQLEVKSGLANGDQVITDGFQNLYDGQGITTE